jgi:DNA-binding response OmpR family regulator
MPGISNQWRHDEPGPANVKRILVVEDNSDLRWLLIDALGDAGFEVHAVSNGAEALDLAETWTPDAIILDVMMPIMDGATFLRERREAASLASIPVLVLTAHPFHRRVLEGLDATLVLRKPYDLDELLAAVDALCAGETGRGSVV